MTDENKEQTVTLITPAEFQRRFIEQFDPKTETHTSVGQRIVHATRERGKFTEKLAEQGVYVDWPKKSVGEFKWTDDGDFVGNRDLPEND